MIPAPVVTAAQMREVDRITIEDAGIAAVVLMELAGRAVASAAADIHAEIGDGPVCVVCGKGNNGGDGFVAARTLYNQGIEVTCILGTTRDQVGPGALVQLDIIDTLGIDVVEVDGELNEDADLALSTAVVIIDALLGIGLTDDVRALTAELIDRINDEAVPVVSVDLPSGINADTGAIMGTAVMADVTVTFALPKRGLMVHPGAHYAGELLVADIGIPPDVIEHVGSLVSTDDDLGAPFLPPRHPNSHKGHFGRILFIAGSPGKGGAALLASTAAMRAGAGLVTLATHARCQLSLEGREPDIMVEAGWGGDVESEAMDALLENKHIIGIGPGLIPTAETGAVLRAVLGGDCPVVLDAGALSMLAAEPELFDSARAPLVLTPHPGEAARLLGVSSADIQADRFAALEGLVELSGGIVVLKGARTLIGAPDGRISINRTGGPGLAKAGTGDVLTGIICAFLARDLEPFDAVRTAVHVHGLTGDRAATAFGDDSVMASDLPNILSSVLNPGE